MRKEWPKVRLGGVLRPVTREESVDAVKEYRLLGVRLDGKGPFLRETVSGTQTSATKLHRVAEGDFIYSRLFACRGAFGVIDHDLDGCHVSEEFPTFTAVPGRIDVNFLSYWFRLATTIARVNEDCTGSTPLTRNRFKEQFFLALEIPLPSLAEQRRVVARVEKLAAQIHEARSLREQEDKEIRHMLLEAFLQVTRGAPRRPTREVAPIVRRLVQVEPSCIYPELGIRSFGKGTFHKPSLSGIEIGGKRIFRIEPGDLLFSNVFAWEGAIAVAKPEDANRVGSHRYITCVPTPGVATAHFLCFFFLTNEGLELIRTASPGGAGRNRTLGLDSLGAIMIPLPRIEEQHWFDTLQLRVRSLKGLQAETAVEMDALLSAVLDRALKGEL